MKHATLQFLVEYIIFWIHLKDQLTWILDSDPVGNYRRLIPLDLAVVFSTGLLIRGQTQRAIIIDEEVILAEGHLLDDQVIPIPAAVDGLDFCIGL